MSDTSATAPLIVGERGAGSRDVDVDVDLAVDESALRRPNAFTWTLTLSACISGLLFGYE